MRKISRAVLPGLLLCIALPMSAPAFAVYKCVVDGKVGYSDTPCPEGRVSELASASTGDTALAESARKQAEQEKAALKRMENERHKREAKEEKEQQRAAAARAVRQKKCATLALRKKWADEDAAAATGKSADKTRRKARRAGEQFDVECA